MFLLFARKNYLSWRPNNLAYVTSETLFSCGRCNRWREKGPTGAR